jgi:hypothetical protein
MSEVVQCDVCEAVVAANEPRRLSEWPQMLSVSDGFGVTDHACSPQCLARLAVIYAGRRAPQ